MTSTAPKYTTENFEPKANYYAVEHSGRFHYYPMKVEVVPETNLIRIVERPPVLIEGLATVGRNVYKVRLRDLHRGIILKSSLSVQHGKHRRAAARAADIAADTSSDGVESPGAPDQSRSSECDWVEVSRSADLAWADQITTLLETLSEEEGVEFELADSP